MEDIFSKFSSGNIKCKYQVVKLEFKPWRKIVALFFYLFPLFLPFILSNGLIAIISSSLCLFFVSPQLVKQFLPYSRTEQLLIFEGESIRLEVGNTKVWEYPIKKIKWIKAWVGIGPYLPTKTGGLSNAVVINLEFDIDNSNHNFSLKNELYFSDDDQSHFRRIPPNLWCTLELIQEKFRLKVLNKSGKERS